MSHFVAFAKFVHRNDVVKSAKDHSLIINIDITMYDEREDSIKFVGSEIIFDISVTDVDKP